MYDFIVPNVEVLTENACIAFEEVTGEAIFAGDERRILLSTCAGVVAELAMYANILMNQNFRQYAQGHYLDILGENERVYRLQPQAALVTMQYTLSAPQPGATTIPAGVKSTPNGVIAFATTADLVIPAGSVTGTVIAQATETGIEANGFTSGTIVGQVDVLPLIGAVTNTDTSQGGTNMETDDHYRERIKYSGAAYSTAGPDEAYIYWARTADASISDASVESPTPGTVVVTVLGQGGTIPTQPILDKVAETLSAETIRPATDNVMVQPAVTHNYDIALSYSISKGAAGQEMSIQAAVMAAVSGFTARTKERLGGSINPDALKRDILNAGAYTVTMVSPAYENIVKNEVAVVGSVNVTYEGLK